MDGHNSTPRRIVLLLYPFSRTSSLVAWHLAYAHTQGKPDPRVVRQHKLDLGFVFFFQKTEKKQIVGGMGLEGVRGGIAYNQNALYTILKELIKI